MKELKFAVMGLAFLLGGCQYHNNYYFEEDELAPVVEPKKVNDGEVEATAIPTKDKNATVKEEKKVVAEEKEEVEDMHPAEPVEKLQYDSAYDRFLDNVIIKSKSANHVTYEYKDVRVDELAPLASRYCEEHGNRTAVLRSVVLYKNYARHATFDCLRLQ